MNDLIDLGGSALLTMTSLEIAELVESRHDSVKRAIDRLVTSGVLVRPPSVDEPGSDAMGRPRVTQVYVFTGERGKRDSIIVVAQLSPEFTGRLVDRWLELESSVRSDFLIPQTRAEALRLAADQMERADRAEAERDEAVRTKALIGSRREATAMATAAAARRQVLRMEEELGRSQHHATITAVETVMDCRFDPQAWRRLRAYCREHHLTPRRVRDPRWGEVKSWPAAAWKATFDIDLGALFGSRFLLN